MVLRQSDAGKPRGFGFVTFKDQRAYSNALADQHYMHGKILDLKAANPREQNAPPPPPKERKTSENRKIFIGGLPKDLSMNEFRGYFEQYGEIVDIAIITDKKTREPRGKLRTQTGFGFVSYKNSQSAREVINDYSLHKLRDRWVECKMSYPKEALNDMQMDDHSPESHSPTYNRSKGHSSNGYGPSNHSYGSNQNTSPVGSFPEVSGDSAKRYGFNPGSGYAPAYGGYQQPYGHYSDDSHLQKHSNSSHHAYAYNPASTSYHYTSGSQEQVPYDPYYYNNYYAEYYESEEYSNRYKQNEDKASPQGLEAQMYRYEDREEHSSPAQPVGNSGIQPSRVNNLQEKNGQTSHNVRLMNSASMSPHHDTEAQNFEAVYASVGASPNIQQTRTIGQGMMSSYSGPLGPTKGIYQSGQLSSNEENAAIYQKGGPASAGAGLGSGQDPALPTVTPKKSIHHENELRKMYASQRAFSGADFEPNPQDVVPRKAVLSRVFTEDLREYGSKEDSSHHHLGTASGATKPPSQFRSAHPIMKSHSLHPDDLPMYQQVSTPSQMFKLFHTEDYQTVHQPRSLEIGALDPTEQVQQRKAELRKAGSQSSVNMGSSSSQGNFNPAGAYHLMGHPQSKFTIHRSNSGLQQSPGSPPGGQQPGQSGASLGSTPPGLGAPANT